MHLRVTLTEFLDWVKTQFGKEYHFEDYCNCPMANFGRERYGFKDPTASAIIVYDNSKKESKNILTFYEGEYCKTNGYVIFGLIRTCNSFEDLAEKLEQTIDMINKKVIE